MSEEKNETESIEYEQDQKEYEQDQKEYEQDQKEYEQDQKEQQQQQRSNMLKEKMEMRHKQQIHFIMTQTNYDEHEASEKLKLYNNDVMKVVGDYLGISPKEDENAKKTKNQKIYSVIRDIMDKGSRNYQIQQDRKTKIEKIKEYVENKNNKNKNINELETSESINKKICKEKID
jgi:hypothetical protein